MLTRANDPVKKRRPGGTNSVAFAELCLWLSKDYLCRDDLQERVGVTHTTIRAWLKLLRARKLVYVYLWRTHGTRIVEYFHWGYNMPDAIKPATKYKYYPRGPKAKATLARKSQEEKERKQRN